ncbi:hypothetical protein FRB95_007700 [Tulasnella sp. JGI-2019a]|nr:hypothetical protein FRB95_007700 [Tulasnella sp. JGI-2019a]
MLSRARSASLITASPARPIPIKRRKRSTTSLTIQDDSSSTFGAIRGNRLHEGPLTLPRAVPEERLDEIQANTENLRVIPPWLANTVVGLPRGHPLRTLGGGSPGLAAGGMEDDSSPVHMKAYIFDRPANFTPATRPYTPLNATITRDRHSTPPLKYPLNPPLPTIMIGPTTTDLFRDIHPTLLPFCEPGPIVRADSYLTQIARPSLYVGSISNSGANSTFTSNTTILSSPIKPPSQNPIAFFSHETLLGRTKRDNQLLHNAEDIFAPLTRTQAWEAQDTLGRIPQLTFVQSPDNAILQPSPVRSSDSFPAFMESLQQQSGQRGSSVLSYSSNGPTTPTPGWETSSSNRHQGGSRLYQLGSNIDVEQRHNANQISPIPLSQLFSPTMSNSEFFALADQRLALSAHKKGTH